MEFIESRQLRSQGPVAAFPHWISEALELDLSVLLTRHSFPQSLCHMQQVRTEDCDSANIQRAMLTKGRLMRSLTAYCCQDLGRRTILRAEESSTSDGRQGSAAAHSSDLSGPHNQALAASAQRSSREDSGSASQAYRAAAERFCWRAQQEEVRRLRLEDNEDADVDAFSVQADGQPEELYNALL